MGFRKAGQKISQAFRIGHSHISKGKLSIRDFFLLKCPLAYFTTKLARISCPIAFQAISEIFRSDLFLKTSVEGMFPTTYVDVR